MIYYMNLYDWQNDDALQSTTTDAQMYRSQFLSRVLFIKILPFENLYTELHIKKGNGDYLGIVRHISP